MTTHADLAEVSDHRIVADWALGQWADRLLGQAGLGVTIVDRHGTVMYYNKWASEHLDRQPAYLGHSVHERHRRKITNPRFAAMLEHHGREPEILASPQLPLVDQRPNLVTPNRVVFLDLLRAGIERLLRLSERLIGLVDCGHLRIGCYIGRLQRI